jgi:hypothetical protein
MSLAADLRLALDPAALFEAAFGLPALSWQRDYLRETRAACLVKGRQTGASLAAAALTIHVARSGPLLDAVVVSPSLRQSGEILGRARAGLRRLGVALEQDSSSMLRLANGSRIVSLPGTAKSVRGWTAKLLVLDEAAYIERDTWTAARALVAVGGRLIVQSTPADESGDFWELVEAADPTMAHFRIRSDEVPTIAPEFLEAERRAMSPDAFAAEYECTFGKVGATLFTADRIASLILPGVSA